MNSECELSVVITSRNDNFGADMLRRLQLFLETFMELGERHGLAAEIILVEWNPPDGPRLRDVIQLKTESKTIPLRFIEVPAEVHRQFRNADVLPLFQMIAKNVGIRRARGRFVLATNQDILFSEPLMEFMASGELDPDVMYRIDRHDIEAEVPDGPADEKLKWCSKHLIRVHGRNGTYPHPQMIAVRGLWPVLKDWMRFYPPSRILRGAVLHGIRLIFPKRQAHTNACGDFTLLSRERWQELRGYAEIPIYSLHIDSLFCWSALAAGMSQSILGYPMRVYHLEHESSWAVMDPPEKLRWFATKPWLDISVLNEAAQFMRSSKGPIVVNSEDWGLGALDLDEFTVIGGELRQ